MIGSIVKLFYSSSWVTFIQDISISQSTLSLNQHFTDKQGIASEIKADFF